MRPILVLPLLTILLVLNLPGCLPFVQATGALVDEKISCQGLVEGFCEKLWASPQLGNMDFKSETSQWSLRLGWTDNNIHHSSYMFFEAFQRNLNDLPQDIQKALRKLQFKKSLNSYLKRKRPAQMSVEDHLRPEFMRGLLDPLEEALRFIAIERTEKQYPGYSKLPSFDRSSEVKRAYDIHLAQAWSEVYVAIWNKEEKWKNVETLFLQIRSEYKKIIQENTKLSSRLRDEMIGDLESVRLVLPGSNPAKSTSSDRHRCGIDLQNAFYNSVYHELTICAGEFTTASPLLTIAHELGHSFSLKRRLQNYWASSDYGKSLLSLWENSCYKEVPKCEEWERIKRDLARQSSALPNYQYEDAKFLKTFLKRELKPVPQGKALKKLANRLSKTTLRNEIDERYIEKLIKPEEILLSGEKVKNIRYLKSCMNYQWPMPLTVLSHEEDQFETFFTAEYACHLEKKTPNTEALRLSIEEASKMLNQSWEVLLRVPGAFSSRQEARDEEFAQDIEEDVVDSMTSDVISRVLKTFDSVPERRARYLASIAAYCDQPSFRQQFPAESLVLNAFSNRPHSIGQDRRTKLLTPNIRRTLDCR